MTAVAARREVVRQLQGLGLSERQALRLVGMSASTLRYQPCDDGNARIAGMTLVLTPYEQTDGSVAWQCNSDVQGRVPGGAAVSGPTVGTLPARFAPSQCRS